jgi:hypothetical protein
LVLAGIGLFCVLPFYLFFGHCPVDRGLLEAGRQIRVGMTLDQARRLMPPGHGENLYDDVTGARLPQDKGFSGFLSTLEVSSVQCETRLIVRLREGRVTDVSVSLYNDFDHSSQEME